jgi:hypothetical protein
MLITFTSKSAADVLMYETHAKPLLDLLGKDTQRGVITAEETSDAIARIESAIAASKQAPGAMPHGPVSDVSADDEDNALAERSVSFAARAFPLLEMLRAAQRQQQFVMWGV